MTSSPKTRINITGVNTTTQQTQVTPFCKVCFDARKNKDIYTSHYVRENRNKYSKVVCPTLIAQTCNYCHKNGHSVSYCPKLIRKGQIGQRQQGSKTHINDSTIKRELDTVFPLVDFENEQDQEMDEFEAHFDNQQFDPNSLDHPDLVHYPCGDHGVVLRNFWNYTRNLFELTDLNASAPLFAPYVFTPSILSQHLSTPSPLSTTSPLYTPKVLRNALEIQYFSQFDRDDAEVCAINEPHQQ